MATVEKNFNEMVTLANGATKRNQAHLYHTWYGWITNGVLHVTSDSGARSKDIWHFPIGKCAGGVLIFKNTTGVAYCYTRKNPKALTERDVKRYGEKYPNPLGGEFALYLEYSAKIHPSRWEDIIVLKEENDRVIEIQFNYTCRARHYPYLHQTVVAMDGTGGGIIDGTDTDEVVGPINGKVDCCKMQFAVPPDATFVVVLGHSPRTNWEGVDKVYLFPGFDRERVNKAIAEYQRSRENK